MRALRQAQGPLTLEKAKVVEPVEMLRIQRS